jgi:hypothetical protein
MMRRYVLVASVSLVFPLVVLPSTPSVAATPKQKMETCKFGADHPMLTGKARADFIKKCMSDKDDPRGAAPGGEPGPEGEHN